MRAEVELDRFCERCGYNLRGQAVRRDPDTELVLSRCPECGKFAYVGEATTIGRVWLRRLAIPLLFFWVFVVLFILFWVGFAYIGMTIVTFEEMDRLDSIALRANQRLGPQYYERRVQGFKIMCGVFTGLYAGLGFLSTMIWTVVLPHWRRWGYVAFGAVLPVGTLAVFAVLVYVYPDDVPADTLPIAALYAVVNFGAAIAAAWLGRPFARLVLRLLLPRRPRAALAYLWLADGKTV